jgi:hypothetical protein
MELPGLHAGGAWARIVVSPFGLAQSRGRWLRGRAGFFWTYEPVGLAFATAAPTAAIVAIGTRSLTT